METDEIKYILAKQVDSMTAIQTNYGDIDLCDDELREAVKDAVTRVLEQKLQGGK